MGGGNVIDIRQCKNCLKVTKKSWLIPLSEVDKLVLDLVDVKHYIGRCYFCGVIFIWE